MKRPWSKVALNYAFALQAIKARGEGKSGSDLRLIQLLWTHEDSALVENLESTWLTCGLSGSLVRHLHHLHSRAIVVGPTCISWRQGKCIGFLIRPDIVCSWKRSSRRLCLPHPSAYLACSFLKACCLRQSAAGMALLTTSAFC
jgi:hypothetical protein